MLPSSKQERLYGLGIDGNDDGIYCLNDSQEYTGIVYTGYIYGSAVHKAWRTHNRRLWVLALHPV
jgi:hypothetical protein